MMRGCLLVCRLPLFSFVCNDRPLDPSNRWRGRGVDFKIWMISGRGLIEPILAEVKR
jgi:hypothetical protein